MIRYDKDVREGHQIVIKWLDRSHLAGLSWFFAATFTLEALCFTFFNSGETERRPGRVERTPQSRGATSPHLTWALNPQR